MRKFLIGALILAILVGFGGYLSSNVSVRAWLGLAKRDLESKKSNEQLFEELRLHVGDMSQKIADHELKLLQTERRVKAADEDLQKCRTARGEHIVQLAEAKKILSNSLGQIILTSANPGRKLSRPEVEADVKKRLQHLAHLKTLIETKETSLQLLKATHENGKKALQEAVVVKNQKLAELENLRLRLANAEHLAEIRALGQDLENSAAAIQSTAFQGSWRELLKRVDAAEISLKNVPTQTGLIDYRDNAETSADLLRAIDAAIETSKTVPK